MNKKKILGLMVLLMVLLAMPALAQEAGHEAGSAGMDMGMLGAAFAIGVAAAGGALGQAKAVSSACSAMARNPGAADNIRFALILGLALIESLVLYALLIAAKGAGLF
ncbi:MAG: ATP synthase F0 subunit C [Thermoanaerobaculia bacterium]|nr:ATP synthase F0 subunit C [Thermoanaerobaculia bacterium]